MKARLYIFLLLLISPCVQVNAEIENPSHIKLVSEEWPGTTNRDGTGLYWDIFRYVYEPVGIKVRTMTLPYEASVLYVQRNKADIWLGSYIHERHFPLYPRWHFDVDPVAVMFRKETQKYYEGITSLTNKKVAWIEGYNYDRYFDVPMIKHELRNRKSIMRMLKRKRIDYFVGARDVMELERDALYPNDSSLIIRDLIGLKLYPGFKDSPKGQRLRQIWDERMSQVYNSEKMKQLFKKWQYDYPFDDLDEKQ